MAVLAATGRQRTAPPPQPALPRHLHVVAGDRLPRCTALIWQPVRRPGSSALWGCSCGIGGHGRLDAKATGGAAYCATSTPASVCAALALPRCWTNLTQGTRRVCRSEGL